MKVLLSGYYGFNNTGDEAILIAITQQLAKLGHEAIILSKNPKESREATGYKAVNRMNPLSVLLAMMQADAVFSGGGGLLQDKTSSRTLSYYLGIIQLAKSLGKRVVIFNQSIGPLSAEGQDKVAHALKNTINIARDQQSLEVLHMLGVAGRQGGDPALLLEPKVSFRDTDRVIIAPRGDEEQATQRLAELAKRLQTEGRRVTVMSFHPSVDDEAAHRIANGLADPQVISTSDPRLAIDTIASSGYVIGVRLHALILAAAAGTPFIGVSYDPKVQGFCSDAGAVYVPVNFKVDELLSSILTYSKPSWVLIDNMRERARDSFKWAIGNS